MLPLSEFFFVPGIVYAILHLSLIYARRIILGEYFALIIIIFKLTFFFNSHFIDHTWQENISFDKFY